MKLHDPVEVLWEDANSNFEATWVDPRLAEYEPYIQKSIGYFLRRDDKVLMIYQTWDEQEKKCGEVLRIPVQLVRKVTRLK